MLLRRLFPAIIPPANLPIRSIRSSARDPFPSKVSHYLYRAKVIDSIRLALRSNSANSVSALFNDRLLDPFIVAQAIRSCPSADSALSVVEAVKSNVCFTHTQTSVNAIASMLAKFGKRRELDALINAVNSRSYKNVRVSHMNLMKWYAEMEDIDSVLDAWDKYRNESEKRVCAESYNIVMRLYALKGLDSEAVGIFHQMADEGVIPNCRTFTIMIEHLVISGRLDPAFEIFQVLPRMRIKRTLKQYSVLFQEFIKAERFGEASILLNEMRADGILPGRALFSYLQIMRDSGYMHETDDLLAGMSPDERIKSIEYYASESDDVDVEDGDNDKENEAEDVNEVSSGEVIDGIRLKPWIDPGALASSLNNWTPNEALALENAKLVWTTRLVCKILRNFKSPESAWEFFCWVAHQPGFIHDAYTVQRIMSLLARHGRVHLVDQLLLKIAREGILLPFSTVKLIIEFYGLSKNPDAAVKVFRHGKALCGTISRFQLMVLYSTLLRTLTQCTRDSDVLVMLDEMVTSGICPDAPTFLGLMSYFARKGDIKTVQKLFSMVRQSGLEPDGYMYKVLISGYCKCSRSALALRVFDDMRCLGLMPDAATKDLLVKSLWKEGKRKEAASVEESCECTSGSLPLALQGHVWTMSSTDINRVYDIYRRSFSACSELEKLDVQVSSAG